MQPILYVCMYVYETACSVHHKHTNVHIDMFLFVYMWAANTKVRGDSDILLGAKMFAMRFSF